MHNRYPLRNTKGALRHWAHPLLSCAPLSTPSLDFRVLLAKALNTSVTNVVAMHPNTVIHSSAQRWFCRAVQKRRRGTPVAYLVGYKEFYGLQFAVNRHTLVPRPESELIVSLVCQLARSEQWHRLHECGTGSGNLAIAIRHTVPHLAVSASDISARALQVARHNCVTILGCAEAITWRRGSLLAPLSEPVECIVANLPYLSKAALREPSIRHEPRHALYGKGTHGENIIRALIAQAPRVLPTGGIILLECGVQQIDSLCAYLHQHSFRDIVTHADLAGWPRVISARMHA